MKSRLVIAEGVLYEGVLREVRKSSERLRPLFEAFTNALESIKEVRKKGDSQFKGRICVGLYFQQGTTDEDYLFEKLVVSDNGIGFDRENFIRLTMYKDYRKGYSNKGSGRMQLLHFFKESHYESLVACGNTFKMRRFSLSKDFLGKNSIIAIHTPGKTESKSTGTTLTMKRLLTKTDQQYYDKLTAEKLKEELLTQYMLEFCSHRELLPEIRIEQYIEGTVDDTQMLTAEDVPKIHKRDKVVLNYSRVSDDGRDVVPTMETETLQLVSFAIPSDDLDANEIKLTSKNEVVKGTSIDLDCLTPKDKIDGNRYLFFLSGEYIDHKDGDTRGVLNIPTKDEFRKKYADDIYNEHEIVLEDITRLTNETILSMHDEIRQQNKVRSCDLEALKEMFLLNPETIEGLTIKLGESEESILKQVYTADGKVAAEQDAKIKQQIDRLDELNPSAPDYEEKLREISSNVVKTIPLQNRRDLTHYVARRKLVLELFRKILDCELSVQKEGERNIDEKLLHDLIFKQSSTCPEESDMWLINEDFIYFEGHSNGRLCDIEVDGEKLFRDSFTAIEEEYLSAGGENRLIKRPDILLFPEEGKCIIIEFKSPGVNVSDHLTQINKYASWILNYCKPEFSVTSFYGYFIGENIQPQDIVAADPYFEQAYHFDYLFCSHKPVRSTGNGMNGSLYIEAIRYSTLLDRAKRRNQIFIEKLTAKENVAGSEAPTFGTHSKIPIT